MASNRQFFEKLLGTLRPFGLVLAMFAACGGRLSPEDGEGVDTQIPGPPGAGNKGPAGPATCESVAQKAGAALELARRAAYADETCQTDDDCVLANLRTECTDSCGDLLNRRGLATVQPVIARVNAEICPDFQRLGCMVTKLPCVAPGTPACLKGVCANFPPAKWASITISQSAAPPGPTPACKEGPGCTLWYVTPDAKVVKSTEGRATANTLSTADYASLDGILRSEAFRISETRGFQCGSASQGISLEVARLGLTTGSEISGCVVRATDVTAQLFKIVSAY